MYRSTLVFVLSCGLAGPAAADVAPMAPLPGKDAAACPAGPTVIDPLVKLDYERAAQAFAVVRQRTPNAEGGDAPSSASAQARAAHLRGELARAEKLLQESTGGSQEWLSADLAYTHGRVLEACRKSRAAVAAYRAVLELPYALPGTVTLAREGLKRLGQPANAAAAMVMAGGPAEAEEAQRAYRSALSQGRQALARADYAMATAQFRDAIAHATRANAAAGLFRGDPIASAASELGLTLYRQKEFDEAEAATRQAIGTATGAPLTGAALYNLGLILEAKGNRDGAIQAYRKSLASRPNQVVRQRLLTLAPTAARPVTTAVPLAGPFPSLDRYCQRIAKSACAAETDSGDDEQTFACELARPSNQLKNPPAPYQAIRLFSTGCLFMPQQGYGMHYYRLAVKTAAGWFASEPFAQSWTNRHCSAETRVREFALRDGVPGGPRQVVLRFEVEGDCVGGDDSETSSEEWLTVAGIGASGMPSATGGIPLRGATKEGTLSGVDSKRRAGKRESSLSVTWKDDGSLQLGSGSAGSSAGSALSGTYRISFP